MIVSSAQIREGVVNGQGVADTIADALNASLEGNALKARAFAEVLAHLLPRYAPSQPATEKQQ